MNSMQKKVRKIYMNKYAQASVARGFSKGMSWLPFIGASMVAGALGQTLNMFVERMFKWFDSNNHKAASKKYYEKMLEEHPTLMKEKPELVAKYWNSLYHFAPHMAKDPLSSGAFIKQSINQGLEELGGPSPDIVQGLTNVEQQSQNAQRLGQTGKFMGGIDFNEANPMKGITQSLITADVKKNPDDYGL